MTLPVPDFDHLSLGDLTHRVRTLEPEDLTLLISHEESHGARTPVLQVLRARLRQLDSGAQPSGGRPDGPAVDAPPPPAAGSQVSPATSGPTMNPPSHGDPTNPTQPRSTG